MSPALLAVSHASIATSADPSIGASLMHMVLGLVAVVGSILLVSRILRAVRGSGRSRVRGTGELEVISRQSLGKGVQVAVVRFGGREVLVGIAGQHISFYEDQYLPGSLEARPATEVRASAPEISVEALEAMFRRRAGTSFANRPRPSSSEGRTVIDRLRELTERR